MFFEEGDGFVFGLFIVGDVFYFWLLMRTSWNNVVIDGKRTSLLDVLLLFGGNKCRLIFKRLTSGLKSEGSGEAVLLFIIVLAALLLRELLLLHHFCGKVRNKIKRERKRIEYSR